MSDAITPTTAPAGTVIVRLDDGAITQRYEIVRWTPGGRIVTACGEQIRPTPSGFSTDLHIISAQIERDDAALRRRARNARAIEDLASKILVPTRTMARLDKVFPQVDDARMEEARDLLWRAAGLLGVAGEEEEQR